MNLDASDLFDLVDDVVLQGMRAGCDFNSVGNA